MNKILLIAALEEIASREGHELNGQDKLVIRTKTAMVLAKQRHLQRMKSHLISGVNRKTPDDKQPLKHRHHAVLLLFCSMLYTRRLSSVLMLSHFFWFVR
jgi:hypothetical protein